MKFQPWPWESHPKTKNEPTPEPPEPTHRKHLRTCTKSLEPSGNNPETDTGTHIPEPTHPWNHHTRNCAWAETPKLTLLGKNNHRWLKKRYGSFHGDPDYGTSELSIRGFIPDLLRRYTEVVWYKYNLSFLVMDQEYGTVWIISLRDVYESWVWIGASHFAPQPYERSKSLNEAKLWWRIQEALQVCHRPSSITLGLLNIATQCAGWDQGRVSWEMLSFAMST